MLTKLIKYEFKSTGVRFLSAFAVYIAIGTILLTIFHSHAVLSAMILPLGGMALGVITFVTLFQRYNSNLYGQEGYLMFTLPVKGWQLLLSKLITACIWLLALTAVGFATATALVFAYTTPSQQSLMAKGLGQVMQYGWPIFFLIFNILINAVGSILEIYFAITVSRLPIWRKLGVLMGFVTFFVVSLIESIPYAVMTKAGLVVTQTAPKVTSDSYQLVVNIIPTLVTRAIVCNGFVFWLDLAWTVVFSAGVFFAITWLMDKKTSLK